MRRPRWIVLGVVAAGVVGLVLSAVLRDTSLAFTLGVPVAAPVATVEPGSEACQGPIDVPGGGAFDVVTARVGTFFKPGSPLLVTVKDARGRTVASGRVAGGYPDIGRQPVHRIRLDRTVSTPRIAVCVRNVGDRRVALYGNGDLAARSSTAYLDGKPLQADLTLDFERAPRSIASLVPDMLERAALFRIPWLGTWTYVVLIALLLVAAPWLLVRAVTTASD